MKIMTFSLLVLLLTAATARADTTLNDYLNRMPAAPKQCCGISDSEKSAFQAAISDVESAMGKDLRQKNKASKKHLEANKDKIEESLTPQTPEKSRKSGKMTREEKKALREEMMRQYGVSPEDSKKLKTMTKEEKTAWAQQTSSAALEKMQNDPQYDRATRQMKSVADQQAAHRDAQAQVDSEKARLAAVMKKIEAHDQAAAAARARDVGPLERELAAMGEIITTPAQKDKVAGLSAKIKTAKMRHCRTHAPKYLTLAAEYRAALKASLPAFAKLDEAGRMQVTGMDAPVESNDGTAQGIKAIKAYGNLLSHVYKYDR